MFPCGTVLYCILYVLYIAALGSSDISEGYIDIKITFEYYFSLSTEELRKHSWLHPYFLSDAKKLNKINYGFKIWSKKYRSFVNDNADYIHLYRILFYTIFYVLSWLQKKGLELLALFNSIPPTAWPWHGFSRTKLRPEMEGSPSFVWLKAGCVQALGQTGEPSPFLLPAVPFPIPLSCSFCR